MLTAKWKILKCHGHNRIKLNIGHAQHVHIEALIVDGQLRFDLLGIDATRELGGVHIAGSGEVDFLKGDMPQCAGISINEPDFSEEFDHHKKVWMTSWKWMNDQTPMECWSPQCLSVSRTNTRKSSNYGWLLSYPKDKLCSPKGPIQLMVVIQRISRRFIQYSITESQIASWMYVVHSISFQTFCTGI